MSKANQLSFIKPEKSPIFYGYVVTFVGTLGILASLPGQTVGVSTFTDPVKDAMGLSRDQFSYAYMFGTILSSVLLGRAGRWFDKIGARWLSFIATVGLAFSLFLCASSVHISSFFKEIFHTNSISVPFLTMVVLFFAIRFTGQGILTMSSRNMIMKWFDAQRGRVNAVRSVATSLGFSASPLWISLLIDKQGWQKAWISMGLGLLVVALIIMQFYRDNPEKHGLLPDGKAPAKEDKKQAKAPAHRQFTAKEALKTRAFWTYSLAIAFYSFFVTGLTFHVVSIFGSVGIPKEQAIAIFVPISFISVGLSLLANILSDFFPLRYFLYAMLLGGLCSTTGLILLHQPMGYYLIIAGNGIIGGIFPVLNSITWPRFYGREHLGAITGKLMSMLVAASALAPAIFSKSFSLFHSYTQVGYLSMGFLVFIAVSAVKAKNPQHN